MDRNRMAGIVARILLLLALLAAAFGLAAQDNGNNNGGVGLNRIEGASVLEGAIAKDRIGGTGMDYSDSLRIEGAKIITPLDTMATLRNVRAVAGGELEYTFTATAPTASIVIPFTPNTSRRIVVRYNTLVYEVNTTGVAGDSWFVLTGSTLNITPSLEAGETITIRYTSA